MNETQTKIPVLVIFGATASGKTTLAERLFASDSLSFFAGKAEIVSADSMQVYKYMDIGTAKPSKELLQKLPHHLIDLCEPSEQFSAGEFVRFADEACVQTWARKKIPVLLGGTAFYIRNFMFGLPLTPQADSQTRHNLQRQMKEQGAAAMHEYLAQLDNISAKRIHIHDEYRILRALEVCVASGKPLSSFQVQEQPRSPYEFYVFALHRERTELNLRIKERVELMFAQGLEKEVAELALKGYTKEMPGMQAIGYREFFESTVKDSSQIKQHIVHNTTLYAKRQIVFFKRIPHVTWIEPENPEAVVDVLHGIIKKI